MPIFEIQGQDGATYEVDAPEEAHEAIERLFLLASQGEAEGAQDRVDLEQGSGSEPFDRQEFDFGCDGEVAERLETLIGQLLRDTLAQHGVDDLEVQKLAPSFGGYFFE